MKELIRTHGYLVLTPGQKPSVTTRAQSGSALSRVGARKSIRPMNLNKTCNWLSF